jgi:FMN-dependent NADH-azoreductase
MKLLQIDSSARRGSVSRQLTESFVNVWKLENPSGEVIRRDLAMTTISPITDEWVQAAFAIPDKQTEAQREVLSLSDALIEELQVSQTIVIGAPMYNFTISSPLKAWIDQIVRPGKTVAFGPEGSRGLLTGKKVIVLTSRGGEYANGAPRSGYDYQEPYLRLILAFIGLTEVTFIHAENQQRREQAEKARQTAIKRIAQFVVLMDHS